MHPEEPDRTAVGGLAWTLCFYAVVAITVFLIILAVGMGGCAVAPLPEGGYVVGLDMSAGSSEQAASLIGDGIGTAATLFGIPGGGIIGGIIAKILVGRAAEKRTQLATDLARAEARRQGERDGWDEHAREGSSGRGVVDLGVGRGNGPAGVGAPIAA